MKTKKVVVGAIAATMLSLSVCPIAPAIAAGETVQISVSSAEVKAGEQFTVNVSLADVPSNGIQTLDFAISYDPKIVTIDRKKQERLQIPEQEAQMLQVHLQAQLFFESSIHKDLGEIDLVWTTGLKDSSYWISKDGVFCTITGTVASTAAEGAYTDLKVIPATRNATDEDGAAKNDSIACGYFKDKVKYSYEVKANNGKVSVKPAKIQPTLRGDADCDGQVKMNDAVLIMQSLSNGDRFGEDGTESTHIKALGVANGDVAGDPSSATVKRDKGGDGLSPLDALRIQEYLIHKIEELN
uniref:Scaffoldin C n=1 Tax=Ruminococcus flavefaciens TaxID=1265 RepID=G9FEU5_RUMFL|nr:scaffoldin C [Ruminococcus flavefaciens]